MNRIEKIRFWLKRHPETLTYQAIMVLGESRWRPKLAPRLANLLSDLTHFESEGVRRVNFDLYYPLQLMCVVRALAMGTNL